MIKEVLVAIIFVFSISFAAFSQTDDKKDTVAIVNKMFAEMANHKPEAIAELFTKEAILTAVIKNKEGKSRIVNLTGETFSKNFSEKKNEIKEDMYAPKVELFGDLALVWGRYVFFIDNKISHCGANAFHLARTDAGWKIVNASTTIEPAGCTDEEKSRKS